VRAVLHAAGELAPIQSALAALRAQHGAAATRGVAPDLVVRDPEGWLPAAALADGSAVPELLSCANVRWGGSRAASAALAWKSYTYWLALPALLGYATVSRVPDLSPANVLFRVPVTTPFLQVGLRTATVAALPDDPAAGRPGVRVVGDVCGYLRATLLHGHLLPVLDRLRDEVNLGRRTLLGSVASGVAHALVQARDVLPGPVTEIAKDVLTTLGVEDLVEITPDLEVRRRTCCLAFTLPQPKICRSCCIR